MCERRKEKYGNKTFQRIEDKHAHAGAFTYHAKHVGGADVSAANVSDIHAANAGHQEAEGAGAQEVGEEDEGSGDHSGHFGRGRTISDRGRDRNRGGAGSREVSAQDRRYGLNRGGEYRLILMETDEF